MLTDLSNGRPLSSIVVFLADNTANAFSSWQIGPAMTKLFVDICWALGETDHA